MNIKTAHRAREAGRGCRENYLIQHFPISKSIPSPSHAQKNERMKEWKNDLVVAVIGPVAFVETWIFLIYQCFFNFHFPLSRLKTLPLFCGQKVENEPSCDKGCQKARFFSKKANEPSKNSDKCGLFCRLVLLKTQFFHPRRHLKFNLSPPCEQVGLTWNLTYNNKQKKRIEVKFKLLSHRVINSEKDGK